MSLYKRGGIWHYAFTVKGKRFRGSTDESNKYLAGLVEGNKFKAAREKWVNALRGVCPTLLEQGAEFTKWIDATHSIEPKTKKCYQNGWRLLQTTKLAAMKLDEITNRECEVATFAGGPSSANQALRTLRRMLTMAKEDGRIQDIPAIKLRKEWPRSVEMSESDAEKIAAEMTGDPKDALLVLRGTAMRPTEAFSMRWEYFNWGKGCGDNGYYQNPSGKSPNACRRVPLAKALETLQVRHIKQGMPTQGWVFPSPRARECHLTTIAKAFTAARKAAGLPDAMVLYTARHGRLSDIGSVMSLKETMLIGGHGSSATALRYQHPDVARMQEKLAAAETSGRIQ
jgi:integrase